MEIGCVTKWNFDADSCQKSVSMVDCFESSVPFINHKEKEFRMMQMTMMWGGKCIVVMIRPGDASRQNALRHAVRGAALRYAVPDTLYKWVDAASSDEKFFAWNIANPDLLRELLQNRRDGLIFFRDYYRPCGGVRTMIPAGDYFREI